jgi:hypothetical protein
MYRSVSVDFWHRSKITIIDAIDQLMLNGIEYFLSGI